MKAPWRAPIGAALLGTLVLGGAGCAGGTLPIGKPFASSAAARAASVLTKFTIHIPRSRGRRPDYISSATAAISIVVDPGAGQTVRNADLTPGSPGCAFNTCTLLLSLKAGRHTFDIKTYDAPLNNGAPQGNVLSASVGFPFTVRSGARNTIAMTLQGVPKSLSVAQTADEDVTGSQQLGFELYGQKKADGTTIYPRRFVVFALDADGNAIVGPGAPKLTMTSSATGVLSNGVASANAPNRFTVTPVSYDIHFVPFTVTAIPSAAAGATTVSTKFNMQLAAFAAPRVYVTDQTTSFGGGSGRLWVFDELGNPIPSLQTNIDAAGTLGEPDGVAYCPSSDELVVVGETSQSLYEFNESTGTLDYQVSLHRTPLSAYCDKSDVYVGNANDVVTVYDTEPLSHAAVQVATSGDWKESVSGAVPQLPWGIVVNNDGVWVTDAANVALQLYTLQGDGSTESAGGPASNAPFGLAAVAGTTAVYYTQRGLPGIARNDAFALSGGFPNISGPFGISQNPGNGYLYVANYYNSTVTRYDVDGNQIALPAGAFAGPQTPVALVVVP